MIRIEQIQRAVASHYDIPFEVMREPAPLGRTYINTYTTSHPRQVAMCLATRLTNHSYSRIGTLFGGRDHSTVIAAAKAAGERDKAALRRLTLELVGARQ